ncbi:MAG: hypothetical protein LBB75_04700 [Oscillospiraceae bacterium]|jgi:hypothetical protein|nr:hypothetical protein [Oscillospiraceae bacterium]
MKRNKVLRTAAILLALVLISTCAMTGTLAKYVKAFDDASATLVRAGKFGVTMTDFVVDMNAVAYDFQSGYRSAGTDLIIVPGLAVKVVGTFSVTNASEVDVEIQIPAGAADLITPKNFTGANLEYALDNAGAAGTFTDDPTTFTLTDLLGVTTSTVVIPANTTAAQDYTVTLWIKWIPDGEDFMKANPAYDPDGPSDPDLNPVQIPREATDPDDTDTTIGLVGTDIIEFTMPLVAVQVLPY